MSERAPRDVHFVGTLPEKDAKSAMKFMLDRAGPNMATMPDGETNRLDYVTDLVIGLRDNSAIHHVVPRLHPGMLQHFGDLPFYTLPNPKKLTPESLHLGYAEEALASWKVFKQLKDEAVATGNARPDLRFQVGIPGDLQLPFMAFKASGFKDSHRKPFMEATAEEMRKIYEGTDGEVVFQLELPSENVLTAYAPRIARPAVARRFAKNVRRLLLAGPEGAIVGVHLCNIDMNNKSLLFFDSPNASVEVGNALEEQWPHGHNPPMEHLQLPLARGGRAAQIDQETIDELSRLKLHADTRKIAGLSHDTQSYDEQERGLHDIERAIGIVGVSNTCGYGRWRGRPLEFDETGNPIRYDLTRVEANVANAVRLAESSTAHVAR